MTRRITHSESQAKKATANAIPNMLVREDTTRVEAPLVPSPAAVFFAGLDDVLVDDPLGLELPLTPDGEDEGKTVSVAAAA